MAAWFLGESFSIFFAINSWNFVSFAVYCLFRCLRNIFHILSSTSYTYRTDFWLFCTTSMYYVFCHKYLKKQIITKGNIQQNFSYYRLSLKKALLQAAKRSQHYYYIFFQSSCLVWKDTHDKNGFHRFNEEKKIDTLIISTCEWTLYGSPGPYISTRHCWTLNELWTR